jgi:hypothetical protein
LNRRVADLRSDITLTNLMNGLHFDIPQLKTLLDLLEEGCETRLNRRARLEALSDLENALEDLVRSLRSGREPSRKAIRHVVAAADQARIRHDPNRLLERPALRPRQKANVASIQQVTDLLTDTQRQVLVDFKTCLVPTEDLKNPVRAGQAATLTYEIQLLEWMRELPERAFAKGVEAYAGELLAKLEQYHGSYPEKKRPAAVEKLADIFRRSAGVKSLEHQLTVDQSTKVTSQMSKIGG